MVPPPRVNPSDCRFWRFVGPDLDTCSIAVSLYLSPCGGSSTLGVIQPTFNAASSMCQGVRAAASRRNELLAHKVPTSKFSPVSVITSVESSALKALAAATQNRPPALDYTTTTCDSDRSNRSRSLSHHDPGQLLRGCSNDVPYVLGNREVADDGGFVDVRRSVSRLLSPSTIPAVSSSKRGRTPRTITSTFATPYAAASPPTRLPT